MDRQHTLFSLSKVVALDTSAACTTLESVSELSRGLLREDTSIQDLLRLLRQADCLPIGLEQLSRTSIGGAVSTLEHRHPRAEVRRLAGVVAARWRAAVERLLFARQPYDVDRAAEAEEGRAQAPRETIRNAKRARRAAKEAKRRELDALGLLDPTLASSSDDDEDSDAAAKANDSDVDCDLEAAPGGAGGGAGRRSAAARRRPRRGSAGGPEGSPGGHRGGAFAAASGAAVTSSSVSPAELLAAKYAPDSAFRRTRAGSALPRDVAVSIDGKAYRQARLAAGKPSAKTDGDAASEGGKGETRGERRAGGAEQGPSGRRHAESKEAPARGDAEGEEAPAQGDAEGEEAPAQGDAEGEEAPARGDAEGDASGAAAGAGMPLRSPASHLSPPGGFKTRALRLATAAEVEAETLERKTRAAAAAMATEAAEAKGGSAANARATPPPKRERRQAGLFERGWGRGERGEAKGAAGAREGGGEAKGAAGAREGGGEAAAAAGAAEAVAVVSILEDDDVIPEPAVDLVHDDGDEAREGLACQGDAAAQTRDQSAPKPPPPLPDVPIAPASAVVVSVASPGRDGHAVVIPSSSGDDAGEEAEMVASPPPGDESDEAAVSAASPPPGDSPRLRGPPRDDRSGPGAGAGGTAGGFGAPDAGSGEGPSHADGGQEPPGKDAGGSERGGERGGGRARKRRDGGGSGAQQDEATGAGVDANPTEPSPKDKAASDPSPAGREAARSKGAGAAPDGPPGTAGASNPASGSASSGPLTSLELEKAFRRVAERAARTNAANGKAPGEESAQEPQHKGEGGGAEEASTGAANPNDENGAQTPPLRPAPPPSSPPSPSPSSSPPPPAHLALSLLLSTAASQARLALDPGSAVRSPVSSPSTSPVAGCVAREQGAREERATGRRSPTPGTMLWGDGEEAEEVPREEGGVAAGEAAAPAPAAGVLSLASDDEATEIDDALCDDAAADGGGDDDDDGTSAQSALRRAPPASSRRAARSPPGRAQTTTPPTSRSRARSAKRPAPSPPGGVHAPRSGKKERARGQSTLEAAFFSRMPPRGTTEALGEDGKEASKVGGALGALVVGISTAAPTATDDGALDEMASLSGRGGSLPPPSQPFSQAGAWSGDCVPPTQPTQAAAEGA